jgi:RimJ/RimL family protein N-acetyltransferase
MVSTRTPTPGRSFELYYPLDDDWNQLRDIRLRAISNFPLAFHESFAVAHALTEADWRERGARNAQPTGYQVVARTPADLWIGTMSAFVSAGPPAYHPGSPGTGAPRANLVGTWVDPTFRGRSTVAATLLRSVRIWAAEEHRLHQVFLHVHEANYRAMRFYEKSGAKPTGEFVPDPRRAAERQIELVLGTL